MHTGVLEVLQYQQTVPRFELKLKWRRNTAEPAPVQDFCPFRPSRRATAEGFWCGTAPPLG
ncbi:hypothetical protein HanXRQr2_Chr01g0025161 [Helianthus annuus]|uniref:Uncharacterized protein n=1 Tax=Helianthus annuus TaxID=4232 RepID=A0A9K3JVL1_HELAN|nr:hypothetical protein HanXRQr2_Chr01g0025161 [Helianthus annuus]KAJ0957189.1 hypothetical protein HanPSC8_Chr01g0024301 [Helianthus annuus]